MREHAYPTDLDPFPRSLRPMETPISKPFVRFRRLGHRESSLESQGPPKMLKSRPRLIVKAQKGASHEGDLPPGQQLPGWSGKRPKPIGGGSSHYNTHIDIYFNYPYSTSSTSPHVVQIGINCSCFSARTPSQGRVLGPCVCASSRPLTNIICPEGVLGKFLVCHLFWHAQIVRASPGCRRPLFKRRC